MKHLFVINPKAALVRGQADRLREEITAFFANYPEFKYDVHITRWKRDAVGFTRRYISASPELVRVYAAGGMGTFFEVINAAAGLPNVQVAYYPQGAANSFLRSFGEDKLHFFRSLRNLVFAPVTGVDLIRWGNNYGINHSLIGLDSRAEQDSLTLVRRTGIKRDTAHTITGILRFLEGKTINYYRIDVDGRKIAGEYTGLMVANAPCFGQRFCPAIDAVLTDGALHIYLIRKIPFYIAPKLFTDYENGRWAKWPDYISHYRGKRISISSPAMMTISFDGELFYNDRIEYTVVPRGLDFVCPEGIDPGRKYKNAL
jgi:diacylglycerol kinase family enzyme